MSTSQAFSHIHADHSTFNQVGGDQTIINQQTYNNHTEVYNFSSISIDKRETICRWLAAPDPSRNYNEALEKRVENTGGWFTQGNEYVKWKEVPDHFLWINGQAGCGKTILSSVIIADVEHHCANDDSLACAYFFFDKRDSQTDFQLYRNLIRSLIVQILSQSSTAPQSLIKLYGLGQQEPSLSSLEVVLLQLISGFRGVYIIIDSLDECGERRKLLKWIAEVLGMSMGNLHLLATSRPEPDLKSAVDSLGSGSVMRVSVDEDGVSKDIETYVDERLRASDRWEEEQLVKARRSLVESASGLFRLAAFQLDEVEECFTIQDLEEQLQTLPRDLNEMYDRILRKFNKNNLSHALNILTWLAYSVRSLTVDQLAEVGIVNPAVGVNKPRFSKNGRLTKDFILGLCSGLVAEHEGYLKLVHLSVREHIFSATSTSIFRITESRAHLSISHTCIGYLVYSSQPDSDPTPTLASYAAEELERHVDKAGGDAIDPLYDSLKEIFTPAVNRVFRLWEQLNRYNDDDDLAEPLYYMAHIGWTRMVKWLLTNGANVNAQGGHYGTALQAAAVRGHADIIELLLATGAADVNAVGGQYGNALQAASIRGHGNVVELLLAAGANVNAVGGKYGSALQAVAYQGSTVIDIAQLLIDRGADVNAKGGPYGSALQAAASEGETDVVELLLARGANINSGEEDGGALKTALLRGHVAVVELLLANGADINGPLVEHGPPLHFASAQGQLAMVELLLVKGADVNALGGQYGSALQAASAAGRIPVVQVLLESGADVSAQGGIYENALTAASTSGHVAIVKLLLDRGADVNARGGFFGNALQAAASRAYGSTRVIQLLIDGGADVNGQGGEYGSALQVASLAGDVAVVELLLANGADVNIVGGKYGSALQAAAYRGDTAIQVVQLLLDAGADVNTRGGEYGSALQAASSEGEVATVELLLNNGAELDAGGGEYGSALQIASSSGHTALVELLHKSGTRQDGVGQLPAVSHEKDTSVDSLLDKDADVTRSNGFPAASHQDGVVAEPPRDEVTEMNTTGGDRGRALPAAPLGESRTPEQRKDEVNSPRYSGGTQQSLFLSLGVTIQPSSKYKGWGRSAASGKDRGRACGGIGNGA